MSKTQDNEWSKYYRLLFWLPIVIAFLLPFIFLLIGGGMAKIKQLLLESDEFVIMAFGSALNAIPFLIVSLLSKNDRLRAEQFDRALVKWIARFMPVLILYILLLTSVTISLMKKLPGFSTAPIVLILVPVVGIPLVLLVNSILGRIKNDSRGSQ
jgi:hypothetical protein